MAKTPISTEMRILRHINDVDRDDKTDEETEDERDDETDEETWYETDDGLKDSGNKKVKSSHLYGQHETLVSEGEEADLHKHLVICEKNPGHSQFVPVKDFSVRHMPDGYQDNDLVEYIKAIADLTVRVAVEMTSPERPEFWPDTEIPYAFRDMKGRRSTRMGTGILCDAYKWSEKYNKEKCSCIKCQHSDTPSVVWGHIKMYTATHVVFDNIEAIRTKCRLFFDEQGSPLVTLDGWTVERANVEEDWCELECRTCDVHLLDQLDSLLRRRSEIWLKVNKKYSGRRNVDKLTFMASHPHGCTKQISVGHRINRHVVRGDWTQYTYTTCTCPGSSGAHVHTLGYDGWFFYDRHVHSGVTSEGTNYSATSREFI